MARNSMVLALCLVTLAGAQTPDPAQRAYQALRERDYDAAILYLTDAIRAAPGRAVLRKDLAYTYLKIGETETARDQFAEVLRLDPADSHAALEYAFLCNETGRTAEARCTFDRLRASSDPGIHATAEQAFQNIDRPLAEGIARWSEVVAESPDNYSARLELARLAEQRDRLDLAADNYRQSWRLRPDERSLLVDLGRVWKALGRSAEANAALLAASRGSSPRVAETARGLLPSRYPYVSEFRQALALDDGNVELRREMAYLLLEMHRPQEAEGEFKIITRLAPGDLLSAAQLGLLLLARGDRVAAMPLFDKVLKSDDSELAERVRTALRLPADLRRRPRAPAPEPDAKEMGERSYRAGYLNDALKYLQSAQEADPVDFAVMLRLGETYNLLRQDDQAIRWFNLARKSPDPAISAEAKKAYQNLRPAFARLRTTVWLFPFFSTRWHDVFSYAQVKTEVRLGRLPFRPYVSLRFIGDTRQTTRDAFPQYLSESALILGLGVASRSWHGVTLWGEAGQAIGYLAHRSVGRMVPDYRGGLAFSRGAGRLLGAEAPGWFAETADDGVFVSRFQNDFLVYSQNRFGYTLPTLARFRSQWFANGNITLDTQRQYWANFVEFGPGLRFRWEGLPSSLVFSVNLLRGVYTRNVDNPRRPNFFDLRGGFWYAFSH
ncbi:MAG: tetratricopeptide repeat protein [Bryobacteraceae bacterium]|jgi:tetratricopeptide (TPR) repeat protein